MLCFVQNVERNCRRAACSAAAAAQGFLWSLCLRRGLSLRQNLCIRQDLCLLLRQRLNLCRVLSLCQFLPLSQKLRPALPLCQIPVLSPPSYPVRHRRQHRRRTVTRVRTPLLHRRPPQQEKQHPFRKPLRLSERKRTIIWQNSRDSARAVRIK